MRTLTILFTCLTLTMAIPVSTAQSLSYPVTFNVDMTGAIAEGWVEFDPRIHQVYISGEFLGWPMPGTNPSALMTHQGEMIYSITLDLEAGWRYYKYFIVADQPTWNLGEWPGDPNREIFVESDMVVNNVWGRFYDFAASFLAPIPNQAYTAGIDQFVPVQVNWQGEYDAYYTLYLQSDGLYDYISDGNFYEHMIYNFDFTIPAALPQGTYKFLLDYYVYELGYSEIIESNTFNIINSNTALEVRQPMAGDIWIEGNSYPITWNSLNVSQVSISYSLDNGQSWNTIASQVPSANGYNNWGYNYYSWTVPQAIQGVNHQSLIKIVSSGLAEITAYSGNFTLLGSPLHFVKPQEGEVYTTGTDEIIPVEILFETTAGTGVSYTLAINSVDMGFLISDGIAEPPIIQYDYLLQPHLPSGTYWFSLLYFLSHLDMFIYTQSPSFTIVNEQPWLEVTSPIEWSAWIAGNEYTIGWNSNSIEMVNIHYSLDNGQSWTLVAQDLESFDGYNYWGYNGYYWEVPGNIEGVYDQSLIRIQDSQNNSFYALSEPFTISGGPALSIIHPTAQTILPVGQPLEIVLEVIQGSDILMELQDIAGNWYYIDFANASQGLFLYTFYNTQQLTPGNYKLHVYHTNTETNYISDFFSVSEAAPVNLDLKLILEGAFEDNGTNLMHTLLNHQGLIPLQQPFGPALPWFGNPFPLWYYQGEESIPYPINNLVDWVLIELRDAPSAQMATTSTVVARQAALLRSTGQVTGTLTYVPAFDVVIQHGLFVVIYHRNHLPVMSAQALLPENGIYSWDFTIDSMPGLKPLGNGLYGLYGGDGDGNGQIQNQDKNNVWEPQSGSGGYFPGDFDLNGQVQSQDKNNIWEPNGGLSSQLP